MLETELFQNSTILSYQGIIFKELTGEAIISLVLLLLLLILFLSVSALISGSEVACFSLSPRDREALEESDKLHSIRLLKLLNAPEKLLATILVGNNFVNIAIVFLSSFITNAILDFTLSPVLGFIVQTLIIASFLLLFGEIIPKVYAANTPLKLAQFMALPLTLMERVSRPINAILISSTSIVNRRVNRHPNRVSVSDLSQALELTDDKELIEDKDILESIVRFGDRTADEVMQSRLDMVTIDLDMTFSKVITTIQDSGFSRIPVSDGTLDSIKGILYSKDLIKHLDKGGTFKWQTVIRKTMLFIPETKKIDALLEEFRKTKIHMAIVVDEYGGTSGIVTLEDVLEEIVGDISDEFDEVEQFYTKESDGSYIFDGKTSLIDFYRVFDIKEDIFEDIRGDFDSLAGVILELKGEIPTTPDDIACLGYTFSVVSSDERRIKKIKVVLPK